VLSATDFECEGMWGYYPDPDNCKGFIQCDLGKPKKRPCAEGTIKVEVTTMNWITVTGISVLQMTMDMFCMPFFHLYRQSLWFYFII
jgi:hypothetical protein